VSWISRLCETYDNCSAGVLKAETEKSLLPIGHTTQYAQIEIVLDTDGNFLSARALDNNKDKDQDENEAVTVIPLAPRIRRTGPADLSRTHCLTNFNMWQETIPRMFRARKVDSMPT